MRFQAVIFNCDGPLVDSAAVLHGVMVEKTGKPGLLPTLLAGQ